MSKTAQEMLERMENLCRKMAAQFTKENSKYGAIGLGSSLAYIDMASYREAVAIVSELPEPVDPLLIEAREAIIALDDRPYYSFDIREGQHDDSDLVKGAYAALRRAREEGVK